jgi:hypothetical protein
VVSSKGQSTAVVQVFALVAKPNSTTSIAVRIGNLVMLRQLSFAAIVLCGMPGFASAAANFRRVVNILLNKRKIHKKKIS